MKDNAPFVFAGLWEGWKDPATQEWLHTCTILPGAAMRAWPISPRVNSPKNNDADLLVPVQETIEYG
jgi:putative SOS response-associated peptidase YedK